MNTNKKVINRIYVIEDDLNLLVLMNELLLGLGYDVYLNDGKYIDFKHIEEYNPDLLIVDWMLPSIEGIDLIRRIKEMEATRNILCMLITGRNSESDKIIGLQAGVDAYLTKPCSIKMLEAQIKNLEKRFSFVNSPASIAHESDSKEIDAFFLAFMNIFDNEYPNPNLKLDDIAIKLGVSKQILIMRIKSLTGQTPYKLLKKYRMDRAKDLIMNNNKFISDIAKKVGYENLPVFSKVFKSEFGISPKSFAKKNVVQ